MVIQMPDDVFEKRVQKYAKRHKCDIELARLQVARWADPVTKSKKTAEKESDWKDTITDWKRPKT